MLGGGCSTTMTSKNEMMYDMAELQGIYVTNVYTIGPIGLYRPILASIHAMLCTWYCIVYFTLQAFNP